MGDMGDDFRVYREYIKARKALHGKPCPECVSKLPKANPSILMPGQRCRIHKYVDPRTGTDDISRPDGKQHEPQHGAKGENNVG